MSVLMSEGQALHFFRSRVKNEELISALPSVSCQEIGGPEGPSSSEAGAPRSSASSALQNTSR